jgi:hypothetical protein
MTGPTNRKLIDRKGCIETKRDKKTEAIIQARDKGKFRSLCNTSTLWLEEKWLSAKKVDTHAFYHSPSVVIID